MEGLDISPEEVESVTKFLGELEAMRTTNPEMYLQAMAAMGFPDGEIPDIGDGSSVGGASTASKEDNLRTMTEAIMKMRLGQGEEQTDGIKLPKKELPKGVNITPEPGFTFKTKRASDGKKYLINMCQHELLEKPGLKKRLNDAGEEVEGMNIPMSVGPARVELDKSGQDCLVCDIIVNPTVITEANEDRTGKQKDFLCQLGMQCIEQKHKDELDRRYKLPKLKYYGEKIQSQLIQDRRSMPKIEEVSSKKSSAATTKKTVITPAVVILDKDLHLELQWVCCDSNNQKEFLDFRDLENSDTGIEYEKYFNPIGEYMEPILIPELKKRAILIKAEIDKANFKIENTKFQISPFKIVIQLSGYKSRTIYLPCAVLPCHCYTWISPSKSGFISKLDLQIMLNVDLADFSIEPDAGSKPWLVSQAISNSAPYSNELKSIKPSDESKSARKDPDALPEDQFHLRLPDNVDQYTGLPFDNGKTENDGPLPEERFHEKDASSSYFINQREQAIKDKREKHEKEKAERINDPNVEYLDVDDFKPGGKFGPKVTAQAQQASEVSSANLESLKKAADIVSSSQDLKISQKLESNLWAELL